MIYACLYDFRETLNAIHTAQVKKLATFMYVYNYRCLSKWVDISFLFSFILRGFIS